MIFQKFTYKDRKSFDNESWDTYLAWETEDENSVSPCGKLLNYLCDDETIEIPYGVEVIGADAFYRGDWDYMEPPVEKLIIPATVKRIEPGAFTMTFIHEIEIDPASPCGIVKNNVLYSGDGKTLLWVLDGDAFSVEYSKEDKYKEYSVLSVPEGVVRIGNFCPYRPDVLQLPASATEILFDDWWGDDMLIRAPKGSAAIQIAKERGWEYEETD